MRVIYANAKYKHHPAEGGLAHMRQFIENAVALGHELWVWHGQQHPQTQPVPRGKLDRLRLLRSADVIYYRVEWRPPWGSNWVLPPRRKIIGNPLVVWEFNTVPEYGLVQGAPEQVVQESAAEMRRLGAGVDLAVCVSRMIEGYVKEKLGFRHAVTVPNGSDPELFRPDVPPVKRIVRDERKLNVVWIGSANLSWHNFDLLRDAAWSIWNRGEGEQIIFHILGQGMRGMRELPPNVNYYGAEDYDQLPAWLSAMDVGLNVYRPGAADYSSPLKVFDYMASGLTVVSTEQPQAREVFEQLDQIDLLVPCDQSEALADALRGLADDRTRLRRQGAAGRQLVLDRYNWRRAAVETFQDIQSMSGSRK
jgi:glycosyltransferase involved in cell wall biosynthesis